MLLAAAAACGLPAALLSPAFVAAHLSEDGALTPDAALWLQRYRAVAACLALAAAAGGAVVLARRRRLEPVLARHALWGRRAVLLAASSVLALAGGEIAVRAALPATSGLAGNTRVSARYHAGFRAAIADQLDARGCRAVFTARTDARLRVLVVGDSMVYGYGIEDAAATFPARLEVALARRLDAPVEVLNAGRPGADTAEETALLAELLDAVDPDLVVLGYCMNDVIDRAIKREYFQQRRLLPLLSDNLGRHSELWRRVEAALVGALERTGARRGWLATIADCYTPGSERLARHRADLERLVHTARRRAPLAAVVFPLFARFDEYPLRGAHAVVAGLLASLDVPALDLLALFGDDDASRWHVSPHDQHPNAEAHALAAEAFADFLLERELLRRP